MVGFPLRRRHIRWTVAVVLGIACAVIVGGALYMNNFMSAFGECKIVVRSSLPSPDGKQTIVIFGKECGATVGFNTQASIALAHGSFSPDKNPAFFVISDRPDVMVRWLGDHAVQVVVPKGAKVFRSEQSVGDIEVEYR
jgi:hypothetical protein